MILGIPFIKDHFPIAQKWLEEAVASSSLSNYSNQNTNQYETENKDEASTPEVAKIWPIHTREVERALKKPQ